MVEKVEATNPPRVAGGSIFASYYGYGVEMYPKPSRDRLEELVGPGLLHDSVKLIEDVVSELGSLHPDWSTQTLESVGGWVKAEMANYRPTLDELSLETLAWLFTWSNR